MPINVQLKILDERLKSGAYTLPQYADPGSAAMDLRAMIDTPTLTLDPGEAQLIPSGIAIHMENPEVAAVILPRSGMGHKHGLVLSNGTGLIDSSYTGPLMIGAFNRGQAPIVIHLGDRIAQLMFMPIYQAQFHIVDQFAETERGAGGFGSSGRN